MRSSLHLLAGLALFGLTACQHPATAPKAGTLHESPDEQAITAVLAAQQAAWNAGDIDSFMQGYWQSPDLRFASGGHVVRGYTPTLERYHDRYSNRALMGRLEFDQLEVVQLSEDAAVVHGGWRLEREDGSLPSGLFTLVFRRINGDWKIISDTTTSAD